MRLWVQISSGTNEPIYAQIVSQVSRAIAKGELLPSDKLPAVRKLAAELVVNPNTVARAYSLLEQQGLVHTKTGAGTFIADPKLRDADAGQLNGIVERMDNIITHGLNLGLTQKQLREMFTQRLSGFAENRTKKGK